MNIHTLISILPHIDECSTETDNCLHMCTNIPGSFIYGCSDGYFVGSDGFTCIGIY